MIFSRFICICWLLQLFIYNKGRFRQNSVLWIPCSWRPGAETCRNFI